jgi:phosphoribosylglycinamide formyltransferase 1
VKPKIIIITGSELRHTFFRKWMALQEGFEVVRTYCEGLEKSLATLVEAQAGNELRRMHLRAREQSEEDFFRLYVDGVEDRSGPLFIPKGEINAAPHVEAIKAAQPDILVCYGSSIIREPLLSAFSGHFLNVHLGLSPYYRGSGTNYWPLVNGEPEFVGATFMHIDAGIDTGEVIHQIRARVAPGDTPVQIGNRLIIDMAATCCRLVIDWSKLTPMKQMPMSSNDRVYKKKDYTEESVAKLYENFCDGLVARYLREEQSRCAAVPLIQQPAVRPEA